MQTEPTLLEDLSDLVVLRFLHEIGRDELIQTFEETTKFTAQVSAKPGNPHSRGRRLSTIGLFVLTSLDQLIIAYFFTKQTGINCTSLVSVSFVKVLVGSVG